MSDSEKFLDSLKAFATEVTDMGVTVKSLLTGHIELKSPGKGADPNNSYGHWLLLLKMGRSIVEWNKSERFPLF